ncbi:MAG: hypothetical protein ACRDPH_01620 [Marmoricola sp.]
MAGARWRAARRAATLGAIALACLAAVGLGRPGAAMADCGGTVTSSAHHHPAGQLPPLAFGDSTMLLSLPGLAAAGYDGNAHGCRQLVAMLPILSQLRAQGRLPHMVAIALGSNCCATAQQIGQVLSILGPARLLVLVTPVHENATDSLERAEARAHPGRILLLDWVGASAGHGSWFQPDGLHLTMPGVYAFTALLGRALPYAYEPCPPSRKHARRRARTAAAPSGAGRLTVRAAARGRVGTTLAFHVADRGASGTDRTAMRLCVTAPGGIPACRRASLGPGQTSETIRIALPRPGRWSVAIGAASGRTVVRRIWASHRGGRVALLAAGDSEMQILDSMLGQDLGSHRVRVTSDARISTGLTNSFYFDWQREARRQAAATRPDVSVVYIGANDGYSVDGPDGKPVQCCGQAWRQGYANLAARMMSTLLRGQAGRVYWSLLPAPRPANFHSLFDAVNAGIRLAAARFPGRVSLIDLNAFFTPGDRYRDTMSYRGRSFTIHESDGIHISAAADAVAAQLVLRRLTADHIIR